MAVREKVSVDGTRTQHEMTVEGCPGLIEYLHAPEEVRERQSAVSRKCPRQARDGGKGREEGDETVPAEHQH